MNKGQRLYSKDIQFDTEYSALFTLVSRKETKLSFLGELTDPPCIQLSKWNESMIPLKQVINN